MRHRWTTEPIDPAYLPEFAKQRRCKLCGCEVHISRGGYHAYSRGSQVFNKSPECIDWDVENRKTID